MVLNPNLSPPLCCKSERITENLYFIIFVCWIWVITKKQSNTHLCVFGETERGMICSGTSLFSGKASSSGYYQTERSREEGSMSHGRTRVPGFLFKPKGVGWRLRSVRFGSDRWLFGV
ncbi:hypothetical protein HanXRQr2_Chr02g0046761 [Helianthus annuus]|uniref:Uncharacterized protein n=1 Tax=Helianthus annuus TaxID=4232 RepID=A0A9K3JL54_HELAN|nr:hypothetical protein HanXRQr2_Chr02g0046761 [Helianthus annuus]KAJ0950279.1 hypothetical protein HanPSC8_Chr02g0046381 [Helianthus annuus]